MVSDLTTQPYRNLTVVRTDCTGPLKYALEKLRSRTPENARDTASRVGIRNRRMRQSRFYRSCLVCSMFCLDVDYEGKCQTVYLIRYFNPFYLLKLIRDGDLQSAQALKRALGRPGLSHLVGRTHRSLELFQELSVITMDENENITPTTQLQRFLEAFDLGLGRMSAWGPDAIVVKPLFGLPQPSSGHADIFVLMPFKESLRPVYEDHMRNVATDSVW